MNTSIRKSATVKTSNQRSLRLRSVKRSSSFTIGLDVGDRYTHFCVLDSERQPASRREDTHHTREHPTVHDQHASHSDGAGNWHPFRMDQPVRHQCGHEVIVANASCARSTRATARTIGPMRRFLARMARFRPATALPHRSPQRRHASRSCPAARTR